MLQKDYVLPSPPTNLDSKTLPVLTLAYIGDVVYELAVRQHLLARGIVKVQILHKNSIDLVRACTQANLAHRIEDKLNEDELTILRRGRNAKGHHAPKGASITSYRLATGLEALVGYLYLEDKQARLAWLLEELWHLEEEAKANASKTD